MANPLAVPRPEKGWLDVRTAVLKVKFIIPMGRFASIEFFGGKTVGESADCSPGDQANTIKEALPPAAVVLTLRTRSCTKRNKG